MKNNLRFITALTLLFLISIPLFSQTYISGGEVSGTWDISESPYIIEGDISVATDERLIIKKGVEVIFTGAYALEVHGRIDVAGTINDSIHFTVQDTSGFYSNNYNGWYGLVFLGFASTQTENSTLEYTHIEFSAGSGVTCFEYSNLVISHSTIKNNKQKGINLLDFSDIIVEHTNILNNMDGGISVNYSAPDVSNFNISNNGNSGVTITGQAPSNIIPVFTNGIISNNFSGSKGGGVNMIGDATANFSEMAIFSNSAIFGGGVYCSFSNINMDKVTLTDNTAQTGGGIYFSQVNGYTNIVSNSILWGDYPDEIFLDGGQPQITYSDVMGGFAGTGNINEDPWFVNSDNNNFELSWDNFPNESFSKSPCIDSGHPHAKYDPDGTRADMGAYYFHQSYSVSPASKKVVEKISMYPNPAQNSISLFSEAPVENVQVCSLSGKVMIEINNFELNNKYDISDLKSGIYIVRINQSNGESITKKLIKK
ncbi:MAG: T9SS type A sorting domain-containing protein [Bacteroidales bacterium]|nr:T9SS type A sorting domain-containing protein [Bacteroidales bacterium]